MKFLFASLLLLIGVSSFAQSLKSIKKSKIAVLETYRLPVDVNRLKDGDNEISAGSSMYKSYVVKGEMNIIRVSWIELKATANPMANSYQSKEFYYLKSNIEGSKYHQFFLYQGNNSSMQETSKANIEIALGKDYKDQVDALQKVNLKSVKKLVKAYNQPHSEG